MAVPDGTFGIGVGQVISYDAVTATNGAGAWWEDFDPRLLYTPADLHEYQAIATPTSGYWNPGSGIFVNHLEYANWFATWWALRMLDVVENYDPDFIYTDGTVQQPFSGNGTGTGIKADAMQRVIADFYNRALQRRGHVDTFSIVKFRRKTNGTVTTEEHGVPANINTNEPWIAEAPVGDWFYAPNFTYDSGMMIRYVIEAVARDGNAALCISILPDGSLDEGSVRMLKEVGVWMRRNGEAVYGSRAWTIPGEGEMVNGRLKMLPGGKLERRHANFQFSPQDFRFTIGKNGALYAFCMTVPAPGTQLKIKSLGTDAKYLGQPVKSVKLLGHDGALQWKQEADGLAITCPADLPFATSIALKIE